MSDDIDDVHAYAAWICSDCYMEVSAENIRGEILCEPCGHVFRIRDQNFADRVPEDDE